MATWAEIQANIDSIYTSIHDNAANLIGGSETGAGANALSIPPPPQSGLNSQITLIVFIIVLIIILFVVWYLFFR